MEIEKRVRLRNAQKAFSIYSKFMYTLRCANVESNSKSHKRSLHTASVIFQGIRILGIFSQLSLHEANMYLLLYFNF